MLQPLAENPRHLSQFLYGLHPVLSALYFKQRKIKCLTIRDDWFEKLPVNECTSIWIARILSLSRSLGIPIYPTTIRQLSMMVNGRAHQGVVLEASQISIDPVTPKTISHLLVENPRVPFKMNRPTVLYLDHLTDVMNLGSILRSAVFFGLSGIIFSTAPTVVPSPLISKLSAGGLESLRLLRFTSTTDDLKTLKDAGFLIVGTAGKSESNLLNVNCNHIEDLEGHEIGVSYSKEGSHLTLRPVLLALGSESRGLSHEVIGACDLLLRIPGASDPFTSDTLEPLPLPSSLNVAVAAGILLHRLTMLRHGSRSVR